jgi:hypothetical protein
MFKKIFNKLFSKTNKIDKVDKDKKRKETLIKLNEALYPPDKLRVVYEEITEYKIKGYLHKLGDKVVCRSNEPTPILVGEIVEFWDNNGKWDSCIPQIKDKNGEIWGVMGIIKPYTDELLETLLPMRALEQWNYLLDDNVKEHSYSEVDMEKKEKQYNRVQKFKKKNREKTIR